MLRGSKGSPQSNFLMHNDRWELYKVCEIEVDGKVDPFIVGPFDSCRFGSVRHFRCKGAVRNPFPNTIVLVTDERIEVVM